LPSRRNGRDTQVLLSKQGNRPLSHQVLARTPRVRWSSVPLPQGSFSSIGETVPRRARVIKREVPPDPRFGSRTLTRFMNKLMMNGKKSLAERIVYTAMDSIERAARRSPIDVFDT